MAGRAGSWVRHRAALRLQHGQEPCRGPQLLHLLALLQPPFERRLLIVQEVTPIEGHVIRGSALRELLAEPVGLIPLLLLRAGVFPVPVQDPVKLPQLHLQHLLAALDDCDALLHDLALLHELHLLLTELAHHAHPGVRGWQRLDLLLELLHLLPLRLDLLLLYGNLLRHLQRLLCGLLGFLLELCGLGLQSLRLLFGLHIVLVHGVRTLLLRVLQRLLQDLHLLLDGGHRLLPPRQKAADPRPALLLDALLLGGLLLLHLRHLLLPSLRPAHLLELSFGGRHSFEQDELPDLLLLVPVVSTGSCAAVVILNRLLLIFSLVLRFNLRR
mmetsp:Transcript_136041/g.322371  ORF Transcript_136041/g.322371 Transcript_136041/m.322371 type:complete len:328 (+) Transcript_136041:772-1755(+)